MSEFFKPWRRKIGVVTLVIACVGAAGWIQSYAWPEHESFGPFEIISIDGVVVIDILPSFLATDSERIPYWSMVVPMTIFSAYFLLSKLPPPEST